LTQIVNFLLVDRIQEIIKFDDSLHWIRKYFDV